MKQSLEASKQGHALKRAQAEAERARVLEVIRSSNSNSNSNAGAGSGEHRERERGRSAGSAGGSRSPTKGLGVGVHGHVGVGVGTATGTATGAGHRRPVPSPPRSAVSSVFSASSAGSFDQVASARLGGGAGVSVQRRFGSPDADRFSSVSGVSGVSSGSASASVSVSSGSSQAKPSRQVGQQQQQQQIPYSAPPTHPDRRAGAGAGGSTTPRHALTQAHRRSPSYQSTTSTSAYTSRSQPSRSSPTGDRGGGGDDDGREDGDGDGEGVWPWNGNGPGSGSGNGKRTRPTRSQSMHQQSSPTTSTSTSTSGPFSPSLSSGALGRVSPPLPPPRRKTRPESVQLPASTSTPTRRGSAFGGDDAAVGSPFANAFESSSGSGAGSLFDKDRDREKDREKNASAAMPLSLSALQRSLSTLHARAQPVLDRARYKAEAGLSRRGFVPHAHNRLFEDERGEEEGVGHLVAHGTGGTAESEDTLGSVGSMGDGTELGVDRGMGAMDGGGPGWESDGSERGGRGRTGSGYAFGRERERERDSLKLPVEGEGWRPL